LDSSKYPRRIPKQLDLFWKSDKNTLRQEMLEIFPEINKKIERLNEIKNDSEKWEEIEEADTIGDLADF
jgi:hypothetical protein